MLCHSVTPIVSMYCCSPRVKDEAFLKSVGRIITIWEERNVFEMDALTRFKASLGETVPMCEACSRIVHIRVMKGDWLW